MSCRGSKHTLEFDFKYDGPGMAKGGSGVLRVDGKEVANKSIDHTTPVLLTFDETFDIGSDTRTAVDDADYQVPFPFTGTISKVDFKLGPSQLLPEDNKAAHEKQRGQVREGSDLIGEMRGLLTAAHAIRRIRNALEGLFPSHRHVR